MFAFLRSVKIISSVMPELIIFLFSRFHRIDFFLFPWFHRVDFFENKRGKWMQTSNFFTMFCTLIFPCFHKAAKQLLLLKASLGKYLRTRLSRSSVARKISSDKTIEVIKNILKKCKKKFNADWYLFFDSLAKFYLTCSIRRLFHLMVSFHLRFSA